MNQLIRAFVLIAWFGMDSLQAQTKRFEVGIEGGINASPFRENRTYVNMDTYHSELTAEDSGLVGTAFQWNINQHIALKTGMLFEQKSYSFQTLTTYIGPGKAGTGRGQAYFNYLTLPVMARLTYGKNVQFFVNAGLFLGLLVKQQEHHKGTTPQYVDGEIKDVPYDYTADYRDRYEKLDFGIMGGLGIRIPIQQRWSVSLEARDHFGLVNILTPESGSRVLQSHSVNLLLGTSFQLGSATKKQP